MLNGQENISFRFRKINITPVGKCAFYSVEALNIL